MEPKAFEKSPHFQYLPTALCSCYIFNRDIPLVTNPLGTLVDCAAFSEAKPISIPACCSKLLIPAIIIHHHSPGPGTALPLFLSRSLSYTHTLSQTHTLTPLSLSRSLQQPGSILVLPPGRSYQRVVWDCNRICPKLLIILAWAWRSHTDSKSKRDQRNLQFLGTSDQTLGKK